MEVNLKALQNRMQQQQLEDDAVVKTGGCRWKSARADKGSVLSYAKDVQDKYRSKYGAGEDPVLRAPPEMPRTTAPSASVTNVSKTAVPTHNNPSFRQKGAKWGADVWLNIDGVVWGFFVARSRNSCRFSLTQLRGFCVSSYDKHILTPQDVDTWMIDDVGEWLRSVNLETYAASFRINEISGQVLLDISLDDLDYMGVTILAHRKLILKGIEDLRKNKRVTIRVRNFTHPLCTCICRRNHCFFLSIIPPHQIRSNVPRLRPPLSHRRKHNLTTRKPRQQQLPRCIGRTLSRYRLMRYVLAANDQRTLHLPTNNPTFISFVLSSCDDFTTPSHLSFVLCCWYWSPGLELVESSDGQRCRRGSVS